MNFERYSLGWCKQKVEEALLMKAQRIQLIKLMRRAYKDGLAEAGGQEEIDRLQLENRDLRWQIESLERSLDAERGRCEAFRETIEIISKK